MKISVLIQQQDKFDGEHHVRINLYNIFSNEKAIEKVPKLQLKLKDKLYEWFCIGVVKRDDLDKLGFVDFSVFDEWEMFLVEDEDKIKQVKEIL